jgi:hypothetical protein
MKGRVLTNCFVILIVLMLFSCSKSINFSSKIISNNYKNLDGTLIYDRSYNIIVFSLIHDSKSNLVYIVYDNSDFKITKKPPNYILTDPEILSFIKVYKGLNCVYSYVDYNNIIRIKSNGIDYIKFNTNFKDTIFLFNENKYKYQYIGNNWYVKKDNQD